LSASSISNYRVSPLNIAKIVILAFLSFYAGVFVLRSAINITFPEQVAFTDPYMLEQIKLLTHGKNIYLDVNEPPYSVALYTPIYHLTAALFSKVFGLTYLVPRLVSFGAAIIVGAFVFLIVRHQSQNSFAAAIASLLPFASHYFYSWIPIIRTDSLALLFAVAAIFVINRSQDLRSTLLGAVLVVLAFYTRQIYLAAAAAIFIYLLINNRTRAIQFLVASTGLAVLAFGVFNFLSEGRFSVRGVGSELVNEKLALCAYVI